MSLPRRFLLPNVTIQELVKEGRRQRVIVRISIVPKKNKLLAEKIELSSENPVLFTHTKIKSRKVVKRVVKK